LPRPIAVKGHLQSTGRRWLFYWEKQEAVLSAPTKQEMLDNVEIAINARITGGAVQSYSIGGRNLQYISLDELRNLRDQLRREIAGSGENTTYASFGSPS